MGSPQIDVCEFNRIKKPIKAWNHLKYSLFWGMISLNKVSIKQMDQMHFQLPLKDFPKYLTPHLHLYSTSSTCGQIDKKNTSRCKQGYCVNNPLISGLTCNTCV